jgi:predicted RNase H-like HicB family nuclease
LELTSLRFENYKVVVYCQADGTWLAEIPSIPNCFVVMPTYDEAALGIARVFEVIAAEYRAKGIDLPADNAQVVRVMRRAAGA